MSGDKPVKPDTVITWRGSFQTGRVVRLSRPRQFPTRHALVRLAGRLTLFWAPLTDLTPA